MNIIKLNATGSSNSFLAKMAKEQDLPSPSLLLVHEQIQGRGQRDAKWWSESGKSLTMSLYIRPEKLLAQNQFYLSMAVSIAVWKVLDAYNIPKLSVKWPNDILSYNKKLMGILIENTVKAQYIDSCIVGIGLNVNNDYNPDYPRMCSLKTQTKAEFNLEEVALALANEISEQINNLSPENFESLHTLYESKLFRYAVVSSFLTAEGELINGIIRGVTAEGQLKVETSSSQDYLLAWPKEVVLQY